MFSTRKEVKKIENRNRANEQLNQLNLELKKIDKSIKELSSKAKEYLLNNDESSFEEVAKSIFYLQDIRKLVQTVKVQFETYVITYETMENIEGLRVSLKGIAKAMDSYPGIKQNNKDFMKFKRSLIKGQVNMQAVGTMVSSLNPAAESSRSQEEFDALKEKLLLGNTDSLDIRTNKIAENDDFFEMINKE